VIAPTSPLPNITHSVIIDGSTQQGFSGNPIVVLNGTNAGRGTDGLALVASNSTINALDIENFGGDGIHITGNNNQITGCFIGTDPSGSAQAPNGNNGVFIGGATNNVIGGAMAGAGNLISGNTKDGVWINGADAQGNLIEGNIIGANLAGTAPQPNGLDGVRIDEGASNNTIGGNIANSGNLISGNTGNGIRITDENTDNNFVLGNGIGTASGGQAGMVQTQVPRRVRANAARPIAP
jgi:hypothetical protein